MVTNNINKTSKPSNFVEKLMLILENPKFHTAIGWLSHGKSFWIEPRAFSATVLLHEMQGSMFDSFARRLSRWGFVRVFDEEARLQRGGAQHQVYQHVLFRRGGWDLIRQTSPKQMRSMKLPPSSPISKKQKEMIRSAEEEKAAREATPVVTPPRRTLPQAVLGLSMSANAITQAPIESSLLQRHRIMSQLAVRPPVTNMLRRPVALSQLPANTTTTMMQQLVQQPQPSMVHLGATVSPVSSSPNVLLVKPTLALSSSNISAQNQLLSQWMSRRPATTGSQLVATPFANRLRSLQQQQQQQQRMTDAQLLRLLAHS